MTAPALLLAPVACGLVLLLSGWAKVGDVTATRAAFISLGVPAPLRSALVVRSLAYVELALGAVLLVTWGAALAVVAGVVTALFVLYTLLVGRVLHTGEAVDCNCFGVLGSDRITAVTLARNVLLVMFAVLAAAFGVAGSGVGPALGDLDGADWWWPVMAVLVAVGAVLVLSPGQQSTQVDDEFDGQPHDYERQPIPFGVLVGADNVSTSLRHLAAIRPQLLVFLSPGCGSCHIVAEWLPRWRGALGPVVVSTVFTQPLDSLPEDLRAEGIARWLDPESTVTNMFAAGRPAAVLLGADGLLAGGPIVGGEGIRSFVDDIIEELASAPPTTSATAEPDPHAGHVHGPDESAHSHEDHGHERDDAEAPV